MWVTIDNSILYYCHIDIGYLVICAVCTVLLTKEISLDLFYLKFRNIQTIYKRYLLKKNYL